MWGPRVFWGPALSSCAFTGAPRFLGSPAFSLRIFWGPAFSGSTFSFFFWKESAGRPETWGPQKRGVPWHTPLLPYRVHPALPRAQSLQLKPRGCCKRTAIKKIMIMNYDQFSMYQVPRLLIRLLNMNPEHQINDAVVGGRCFDDGATETP